MNSGAGRRLPIGGSERPPGPGRQPERATRTSHPERATPNEPPEQRRGEPAMQKIVTNLWYDGDAEEAANFYCSLLPDSRITDVTRFTESGMGTPGAVMRVDFELAGQRFTAINGGGEFHYTHAMSLLVNCEDQAEVDRLWEALLDGGKEIECGWLADRYGVHWQIWPAAA